MPLVSISNAQRCPMPPDANWLATIPHGLPPRVCPFSPDGGSYLAFLGRISPEKRPDRAIKIAKHARIPLKIAAKVDTVDLAYFKTEIEPLLDDPLIEFIGETGETQKSAFLGKARALLFPIDWPEPFGLVMIEAMSAGTPVIAWPNGSVPEVITDGITGRIVNSIEAAAEAARQAGQMDRRKVRAEFAVFGRLAYPVRVEVTKHDRPGRKSPGCPAPVYAAAGTIWGVSKLGGITAESEAWRRFRCVRRIWRHRCHWQGASRTLFQRHPLFVMVRFPF
jgi:glycosyltransferase involved in cell wall biosynthesis